MPKSPLSIPHVIIGCPSIRHIHIHDRMDGYAILWACAKARQFMPAKLVTTAPQPHCNQHLRDQPLPDPKRFNSLRERIGYWESVLELDDPEVQLGAAVCAAFNTYFHLMGENHLATKPKEFIRVITESAREWAEECFH
jgi:hypothetical protein